MEIYLKYREESTLIVSSIQNKIDDVIVELDKHTLNNIKSHYIMDTLNNRMSSILPKKDVEFSISLKIYGTQKAISKFIDLFNDYKKIQDYNQESPELIIKPTNFDIKVIPYTQRLNVLLDGISITDNIYNDVNYREVTLKFIAPISIVDIEIEDNKDYYTLKLGEES